METTVQSETSERTARPGRTGRADQYRVRPVMRWRLFVVIAVVLVAAVTLFLVLVRDSVTRFVRHDEIERLRSGPLDELMRRCANYLVDRDRTSIEDHMATLVAQHDDVVYACFVDQTLESDRLLAYTPEPDRALRALAHDPKTVPADGRVHRIDGEAVVDITDSTNTIPAYTVHLGLRKEAIDERTRDVFVKMGVIAVVIAGCAIAVAFGAINLIAGPVEKLATNATRLSLGDMRVTFKPRGRGEIGRLADALDRLKESVLCALRRCSTATTAAQRASRPAAPTPTAPTAAPAPSAPPPGKK